MFLLIQPLATTPFLSPGRLMSAGVGLKANCASLPSWNASEGYNRAPSSQAPHGKTIPRRKSARRGRLRMYVPNPEARFLGPADPRLLPQNDHGPGKLASRSLFWRTAESV